MSDASGVPIAITFPSVDMTFARFVGRVIEERQDWTPGGLEDRLRRFLPTTRVHRRLLSGERPMYWYIYRDGRIVAERDKGWWEREATAHATVDRGGTIIELDDAAAEILGGTPKDLRGTSYTAVTPADAQLDAAIMLQSILVTGWADSLCPIQPLRGDRITIQFHVEVIASRLEIDFRPHPVPNAG